MRLGVNDLQQQAGRRREFTGLQVAVEGNQGLVALGKGGGCPGDKAAAGFGLPCYLASAEHLAEEWVIGVVQSRSRQPVPPATGQAAAQSCKVSLSTDRVS